MTEHLGAQAGRGWALITQTSKDSFILLDHFKLKREDQAVNVTAGK